MTAAEFNRHQTPPGGWAFRQAATGWTAPTPIASTFQQTVQLIIKHRKQNAPITAKHKLATDPEAVALELESYTRKRLGLPEVGHGPFTESHNIFAKDGPVVAAEWMTKPRQMATGFLTTGDWLQDGPVEHDLAEQRAAICVDCPQNQKGDWTTFFTAPVSKLIHKQMEEKTGLKLFTSHDENLGVCKACLCPMRVKVHVKKSTIMGRIKEPELKKLDQRCWILKEP